MKLWVLVVLNVLLIKSLQKGSLNGTADDAEEKFDGISKMNETLKKNSLDINILKFLAYRIDSLDNTIGNILDPHNFFDFSLSQY